jgi:hypothetical protein
MSYCFGCSGIGCTIAIGTAATAVASGGLQWPNTASAAGPGSVISTVTTQAGTKFAGFDCS